MVESGQIIGRHESPTNPVSFTMHLYFLQFRTKSMGLSRKVLQWVSHTHRGSGVPGHSG